MDKNKIQSAQNIKTGDGIAYNETVIKDGSIDTQSLSGINPPTNDLAQEIADHIQADIILDRYKVVRELGEGSFGKVFLAKDEKLNRLVAVKVAKKTFKEQDRLRSFIEEARVLASLDHPHIVPIYDVGNSEVEGVFFVSKFIDGVSLSQKIKQGGCSVDEAMAIVLLVSEALGHAHEKGLVHRDIKPDNILIDQMGKPHVADFGLALKIEFLNTNSGFNGTPAYMSPEQAEGRANQVDCRSDIFSLGVVFYELLTGKRLFTGVNLGEIIEKVVQAEVVPPSRINPSVPDEIERVCLRALCKNRDNRYATAKDFCNDLQSVSDVRKNFSSTKKLGVNYRWFSILLASTAIFLLFSAWLVHRGYEADLDGKAKAMVSGVLFAEGKALAKALEKSDELFPRTSLIYRHELAGMDKSDPRRVNAILGLGVVDPILSSELCVQMLKANVPNFLVIRKRLEPLKESLIDVVVEKLKKADGDELLRIGGALALWAPDNLDLEKYIPKIIDKLVAENKLLLADWIEVYRPLGEKLYPLLMLKITGNDIDSSQKYFATALCSDFSRNSCSQLFDLMEASDPNNAILILEKMIPLKNEVLQYVQKIRSDKLEKMGFDNYLKLHDRQGIAAAIQISFGDDAGFSIFSFSSDPTSKSKCQLILGCLNVLPSRIMEKINNTSDVFSKISLIIALGDLDLDSVDLQTKNIWAGIFLDLYQNNPDAGLHGALEWLLRKRWGLEKECDRIVDSLKSKMSQDKKWFVNSIGQTFVVVGGPVRYTMGSPHDEPLRYDSEVFNPRYISKSIAVGQKEVTVNEFLSLMPEQRYIEKYAKTPDTAMSCISWYDCARYCNLLTEKEFTKEDCVYLPNKEGLYEQGMRIVDEPLKKKGYRMPTEAEFEFFQRGGSTKAFSYGSDPRLLDRYSFYAGNSKNQLWPVGTLRPNGFGLFDTSGNAFEWCLDIYEVYYDLKGEDEDFYMQLQDKNITTTISRCMRSGCFYSDVNALRSADRNGAKPDDRSNSRGLRLVRSLP